jgi:hypothetical protein
MAITKAQQARQMLIKGGVVHSDGRRGFFTGAERDARAGRGDISPGTDRQGNQRDNTPSSRRGGQGPFAKPTSTKPKAPPGRPEKGSAPKINRFELAEKNRKAKEEKERKERILEEQRRKQQLQRTGIANTSKFGSPKGTFRDAGSKTYGPFSLKDIKIAESVIEDDDSDDAATAKAIAEQNIFEKILGNIPSATGVLKNILPKNPFDKIIGEIEDDPGLLEKVNKRLGINLADDVGKKKYKELRQQGVIGAYGRPMGGFKQDKPGGEIIRERDNEVIPQATPTTTGSVTPEEEVDDRTELEKLLAARGDAFRFFADGGMADDDDPVGGIMDLESGRQMYFAGKLVKSIGKGLKSITKGIKKVAKSPIGKAAILGAIGFGIPGVKTGFFSKGLMGTKTGLGLKKFLTDSILGEATMKQGFAQRSGGLLNFLKSPFGIITGTSLLSGLMTPKQKQELLQQEEEEGLDIAAIRRDPYGAMGGAYSFYAEGGKAEPVAKKTMPLLDMDGMEKDYRETGGFVEMGRMERADDVPARLSNNEFTADAVRNAGDGSVDKGAEVMYNMMKNLESGGEVSEESQGLEGARKMFQTSQRLGEVI